MPDGAYIELLSFTHPESHYPPSSPAHEARCKQPWANKPCGWVAYAFLGAPQSRPQPVPPLSTLLNKRLRDIGSSTRYEAEVAGGRRRLDGLEIKWEVTPPAMMGEKVGGTRLPFFCGDLTPRELRVRTYVSTFIDAISFCAIGTNTAEIKHQTSKWRAGHRTSPRVGPT
jgi:hypothetical protein